jgi:[protein-PII] uridylyltransferase
MPARHLAQVEAHANRVLTPASDHGELIKRYRSFLKKEDHRIRLAHRAGLSGPDVCRQRADLLDVVLRNLFASALQSPSVHHKLTLIATGGYGRAVLNPGSDVDLNFLYPGRSGRDISPEIRDVIEKVITMLWDVGFKVGHAVRSLKETFSQALEDHQTMCALIESRFIIGDRALYDDFTDNFRRQCVKGREMKFLEARVADLRERHGKASHTVTLQEPNVKSGCGGLRDYHNMIWICWVKLGIRSLDELVKRGIFSESAGQEIARAYEFLLRVRNDMHYSERRANDNLSLRLQGVVATNLGYEGRRIVHRCETFMRDYYHHARQLYWHNLSLMERFEIEKDEAPKPGILSFLAVRHAAKKDSFDGFTSKGGFIFPEHDGIFSEDSGRLIRLFQHTQQRQLKLSPPIRQLVKKNYAEINRTFRYRKTNRETWEAILSRKGEVGTALRQMHRVGFLGRYMPEFMPMTDLVQHEFFHRYTADEHTLKCLEKLDELSHTADPKLGFHQKLFHDLDDAYVVYLALFLHDTGRAEGVKHHAYASTQLTDQVCRRLQISDKRRRALIFLVDNHLLFWTTATTQNLDEPEVIAAFAKIVQSREWLDALFLHTYADSRATNDTGWTEWKESLVRHLYHAAAAYFDDQASFQSRAHQPLDDLKATVAEDFNASYAAELEAHFSGMPARYFNFREPEDIRIHVRACRQFFKQLKKDDPASALEPVLRWVAQPDRGCSEVILVTWDRHLLCAKAAGALAACGLNILGADLFVRADGIVIDIFRVCTLDFQPVTDERVLARVEDMLKTACAADAPDDDATIRTKIKKLSSAPPEMSDAFPARVHLRNDLHRDYTVVDLQTIDRIGLLYDVFHTIGTLGLEITHARISTESGAAIDTLWLADRTGKQITDRATLDSLQSGLERVAGAVRERSL